jgi:hypothetical protein
MKRKIWVKSLSLLAFIVFLPFLSPCQTLSDTIITTAGDTIICRVTNISFNGTSEDFIAFDIGRNKAKTKFLYRNEIKHLYISEESRPRVEHSINKDNTSLNAENQNGEIYNAGKELTAFSKQYFTGITLSAIGSIISMVSTVMITSTIPGAVIVAIIGGVTAISGVITTIAAHKRIEKAGEHLMNTKGL